MYDEAVSFFEHIVRKDRPVREILSADYTFLNQPLAKFYGVKKDVQSKDAVEMVEGANGFQRGGLLRLGAVLTATSGAAAHQPGEARRLGAAADSRHAGAAASGRCRVDSGRRQTLRRPLREGAAAGAQAERDLRQLPHADRPAGLRAGALRFHRTLAREVCRRQGDRRFGRGFRRQDEIAGIPGLLDYLQAKDEQVRRTLAFKMVGYALGRTVQASDEALIDRMVQAGGNATFSQLAAEIVTSKQFRNRSGREDAGSQ